MPLTFLVSKEMQELEVAVFYTTLKFMIHNSSPTKGRIKGLVITSVCLSVCLFACHIAEKVDKVLSHKVGFSHKSLFLSLVIRIMDNKARIFFFFFLGGGGALGCRQGIPGDVL